MYRFGFGLMWVVGTFGCGGSDGASDAAPSDAPSDSSSDAHEDAGVADGGSPLGPYPPVTDLPARDALPDLFMSFDGTRRASDVSEWEAWRQDELRDLFAFYQYGYAPSDEVPVTVEVVVSEPDFIPDQVRYDELAVRLGDLGLVVHVALFTPHGVDSPPVFVAPNRCGNQEVTEDPRVRATTAWQGDNCGSTVEESRGVRAYQWPISSIAEAGFAFATFHESEIDPDDEEHDFANGVHAALVDSARDPRIRWGRVAAWAWGVSRVIDGLLEHGTVDATRIAAVGHSRRGKTVLLAAAHDPRIALVIAHQSGTGGVALHRSLEGETLELINALFPSWFNDVFPTFARRELQTPVDQHQLIALVAPRAVLATDGSDDRWADPDGARAAVLAASPAWELYGAPGVVLDDAGAPTLDGPLAWHLRPGDHDLTDDDWATFLEFARRRGW
ncbi:MAG: acetylxylan esterase [Myxococcota bacterium]|jgi:hypothetical protein|nr:acetylxylan esterase [Myxococcota bacterium]